MQLTQLEHRRRQIALVRAVKANDIAKVRRLLKNCREWDSVYDRTDSYSDLYNCSCCFKFDECLSPARNAALRTAIALGLRDMVNLTLDAGIQFSPGGKLWESCFFSTAVKFEQVDILRLLLERNIGSAAWMGWSALESAMKTGVLPLIEPFIEHGIVTRDEAMERAMITGKLELVRALRKRLRPASELSDLLHDAGISAARDHLELVKYFLELIRHKHPKRFQVAVLDEFQSAPTVPMLEFLISLTNGIPDDVRNRALRRALSHGYECCRLSHS